MSIFYSSPFISIFLNEKLNVMYNSRNELVENTLGGKIMVAKTPQYSKKKKVV